MAPQSHCKHEGCTCAASGAAGKDPHATRTDGYCSQYCAEHAQKPGHKKHACGCGHPGCGS